MLLRLEPDVLKYFYYTGTNLPRVISDFINNSSKEIVAIIARYFGFEFCQAKMGFFGKDLNCAAFKDLLGFNLLQMAIFCQWEEGVKFLLNLIDEKDTNIFIINAQYQIGWDAERWAGVAKITFPLNTEPSLLDFNFNDIELFGRLLKLIVLDQNYYEDIDAKLVSKLLELISFALTKDELRQLDLPYLIKFTNSGLFKDDNADERRSSWFTLICNVVEPNYVYYSQFEELDESFQEAFEDFKHFCSQREFTSFITAIEQWVASYQRANGMRYPWIAPIEDHLRNYVRNRQQDNAQPEIPPLAKLLITCLKSCGYKEEQFPTCLKNYVTTEPLPQANVRHVLK